MFSLCVSYFEEHMITISTNINIKKSKTKCIFFSHTKSTVMPTPIMFNENELDRFNLATKAASNLDKDLEIKRRKFIGKYHSLKQEFGFSSSEVLLKLANIYATSFYGSVLWDLNGSKSKIPYILS